MLRKSLRWYIKMKQTWDKYVDEKMGKLIKNIEANPESFQAVNEFGKFYNLLFLKQKIASERIGHYILMAEKATDIGEVSFYDVLAEGLH